jgi:hypothetical protein
MWITKKYDQFYINNLNIYTISLAYGILSTHLTKKQNKHKSRCPRKSYWCTVGSVSRVSEYKKDILKNNSKRTYNLFNTLNLGSNP